MIDDVDERGEPMYARVASFEYSDMSRVDELISLARERRSDVPEATGVVMLADRAGRTARVISFFDSEEALHDSELGFERMAEAIPAELRGKRTGVERFEVDFHEGGSGARAARFSSVDADASRLDESLRRMREDILPRARRIEGWAGAVGMVDRATGKLRLVTLWESEDALRASESAADELRRESAELAGGSIAGVERYEVMFAELPAEMRTGTRAER
jgi:hypothetical protein